MNVNKKFDRFKQWAGERMGGEVKTSVTDEFKAIETETAMRHDGLEKMHKTMGTYLKSIAKRLDADNKEKSLPISQLGSTMVEHGDEFEHDSLFGQCLTAFGRTQERMSRSQEAYIAASTNTWMDSLDRSMAQMKEYQAARKKLEQRRLAYDTSLAKMQKAKGEDFRVEEELRSQKAKYEEAEDDVYRRMVEIQNAESDSTADLGAFLDAQLTYHERCREALIQLRNEWPASHQQQYKSARPVLRSRSNTGRSYLSNQSSIDEEPNPPVRVAGRTTRTPSSRHLESAIEHEVRPPFQRASTYDSHPSQRRDVSQSNVEQLARVPSDPLLVQRARSNLKISTNTGDRDVFSDESTIYTTSSERSYGDRNFSPATSVASSSATPLSMAKKKAPPPPPPSRTTKPAPPPPPAKRSLVI